MLRDRLGRHRVPPFIVNFYPSVILTEKVITLLKEPLEVLGSRLCDISVDLIILFGLSISIIIISVVLELFHRILYYHHNLFFGFFQFVNAHMNIIALL